MPLRPALAQLLLVSAIALRAETDLEKAVRLLRSGDPNAAMEVLEPLHRADPKNVEVLYQLGRAQLRAGLGAQAQATADQCLALQPARADLHVLLGNALGNQAQKANVFRALGLAREGLAELEKAVRMEPSSRVAREALFNWYCNAPSLGGGGLDKAMAFADQTLPVLPGHGHYFKAQVFVRRKDPGAAQKEGRLAIAADPHLGEVYNLLGYVELEMKQLEAAVADFRKQVELRPEDPNSYDSLGDGLAAKGSLLEAIQAYRKGLELSPRFWECAAHLGTALERAGLREEAIAHYRRYLQLSTQLGVPAVAKRARESLKRLGVQA